jgi:hypothetical protein
MKLNVKSLILKVCLPLFLAVATVSNGDRAFAMPARPMVCGWEPGPPVCDENGKNCVITYLYICRPA